MFTIQYLDDDGVLRSGLQCGHPDSVVLAAEEKKKSMLSNVLTGEE